MTGAAMQKRIALATGRAPTRVALYDDPEIKRKIPQLPALLDTFKQAVPRPTTPVYAPLSNIMQRYFSSVLALPNTDINKRAALAARDMNRVLDLLRDRPVAMKSSQRLGAVLSCCQAFSSSRLFSIFPIVESFRLSFYRLILTLPWLGQKMVGWENYTDLVERSGGARDAIGRRLFSSA